MSCGAPRVSPPCVSLTAIYDDLPSTPQANWTPEFYPPYRETRQGCLIGQQQQYASHRYVGLLIAYGVCNLTCGYKRQRKCPVGLLSTALRTMRPSVVCVY